MRIVTVFQLNIFVGIAFNTDNRVLVEGSGICYQHILDRALIESVACEIILAEGYVEFCVLTVLDRGDVDGVIGVCNRGELFSVLVSEIYLNAVLIEGQTLAHFIVNRVSGQLDRRRTRRAVVESEINGVADADVGVINVILGGIGDLLKGFGRIVLNLGCEIDGADGVDPTVVFEVRQNHNRVFNRLYACGKACAFHIVNALLQIGVGLGFVFGIKYAAGNRGCGHFAECGRNAVELVQNVLCLAGLYLVGNAVKKRLVDCFKGRRVAVLELGNLIHLKGVAGLVAAHLEGNLLSFIKQRRRRRERNSGQNKHKNNDGNS